MKIRTQFRITVALFGAVIIAVAVSLLLTNRELERLYRQETVAHDLELGARDLSYLANDYLLHGQSAQRARWQVRYASFSNLLASVSPESPEGSALATTWPFI